VDSIRLALVHSCDVTSLDPSYTSRMAQYEAFYLHQDKRHIMINHSTYNNFHQDWLDLFIIFNFNCITAPEPKQFLELEYPQIIFCWNLYFNLGSNPPKQCFPNFFFFVDPFWLQKKTHRTLHPCLHKYSVQMISIQN